MFQSPSVSPSSREFQCIEAHKLIGVYNLLIAPHVGQSERNWDELLKILGVKPFDAEKPLIKVMFAVHAKLPFKTGTAYTSRAKRWTIQIITYIIAAVMLWNQQTNKETFIFDDKSRRSALQWIKGIPRDHGSYAQENQCVA